MENILEWNKNSLKKLWYLYFEQFFGIYERIIYLLEISTTYT